jgi:hypothetical protein
VIKFPSVKNVFNTRTRRNNEGFARFSRQFGLTAAAIPTNLCEGSVSYSDQHSTNKLKILDFSEFEDAVEVSKNENNEIEKCMHINVSHVDLNDLLDWWKKT